MKIKILLADDHRIVREGLRVLLEKQPDIEVIAEAEDGTAVLRIIQERIPDIVVIDIAMPNLNGIETTSQIKAVIPSIKVIALSMYSDRRLVARMLKAGASGYLIKDCAFNELALAIRTVVSGRIYLSPMIVDVMVKDYLHRLGNEDSPDLLTITSREREIVQLLAEGKSTKNIAQHLSISVKTVETHRQQIMRKLHISSIAELTKYAIREGLTFLEK